MLWFHHKHVMRGLINTLQDAAQMGMWYNKPETLFSPQRVGVLGFLWSCDAFHQESLVKLYLLMTSTNRNSAQVLPLTFVKSALCLQMSPYRHESLSVWLRDFLQSINAIGEDWLIFEGMQILC